MYNLLKPLQWTRIESNWETTDFKGRNHVVPDNGFQVINSKLAGPSFSLASNIQKQVNEEFIQWLNPEVFGKLAA